MQYLTLLIFGLLCLVGLFRPTAAMVLLFVLFAIKVALQASFDFFRTNFAVVNFAVAGVVFVAILYTLLRTQRPLLGSVNGWLAVVLWLLGWSILSFLWTPATASGPNEGFNIIVEGYPYFIIYVLLGPILISSLGDWRRATTLMLAVGSLVALSIILSPDFSIRSGRLGTVLSGVQRTSPLAIAQMGGLLAIFGALAVGGRASSLQSALRLAAFISGALLTLFSGTRGEAIFAVVTIAAFLPLSRRLRNVGSYITTLLVALVIGLGAFVMFNFTMGLVDSDRWQTSALISATTVRQWSVLQLLGAFIESPLAWFIGLGYNAFSSLSGVADLGYVHNLYAEILCELGIPAFVLFVMFVVRVVRAARSLMARYGHRTTERSSLVMLMGAIVYSGLIATKEGNLWSAFNVFMFGLILIRLDVRTTELGDAELDDLDAAVEEEDPDPAAWSESDPDPTPETEKANPRTASVVPEP